MGKSMAILEKIALKIKNIKIRNFTSKELKLWNIDHSVKPLEGLENTISNKSIKQL